jgi:hypothetical protein
MAINFPVSPTVNQTFSSSGNTWVWTGYYWKSQGAGTGTLNVPTNYQVRRQKFTATGNTNSFTLTQTPSTVTNLLVYVSGIEQAADTFTLSGNVVTLTATPGVDAVVEIVDFSSGATLGAINRAVQNFTATANQTIITSAVAYSPALLDVYVNGLLLNNSQYTATDGSTVVMTYPMSAGDSVRLVTYTTVAPNPVGFVIKKQTFVLTRSTTTFTITDGYPVGYIDVFLNGSRLVNGYDYTATDALKVVLVYAAAVGDVVETQSYFTSTNTIATGYTGSTGSIGSVGYTGSTGFIGSFGYAGSLGYTGSTGARGPSGGYTGSIGYAGSQGPPNGYTGSSGYIGSTGYTGSAASLPTQTGNSGLYLTTNGAIASWAAVSALPAQNGNAGLFLSTSGSAPFWSQVLPSQSGNSGLYLTTNGNTLSWGIVNTLPAQANNTGKFLTTDGVNAQWAVVSITPSAVSNQQNTSTGAFDLPVGTTAQRPSTAYNGYTRINTDTNYLEVYYSASWLSVYYMGQVTAAGGNTVSTVSGYKYHTFTTAGTFSVSAAPPGSQIEVYIWGAGGGYGNVSGWTYGSPGGAGGAAYGILTPNGAVNYSVLIGGGGVLGQSQGTSVLPGGGGGNSSSVSGSTYGAGGGGYSAIFTSASYIPANVILLAGGGGGGGSSRAGTGNQGGAGGGSTAEDGYSPYDSKPLYRGRGGTPSAAGANASTDAGTTNSGAGQLSGGTNTNGYGGAGGGGWWGGSAGGYSESNTMGGGGGGSGYINTSYIAGGVLYVGTGTTPGNQSNSLRGTAGNPGLSSGASYGNTGVVIFRYPSA